MKKILVVNKYHFLSGGAERYFFAIMAALGRRGIEALPFSVNYRQSLPTPFQRYFVEPAVPGGAAKIQHQRPSPRQKLALLRQSVYNERAAAAVKRMIAEQRPQIAYFLNFNNHISPSAISACVKQGVPVVMRMSDFNLVCSANMYYRDGRPCTDCKRGLYHGVIHRCVHGSWTRSLAGAFAIGFHRLWRVYERVSAFVCPSLLMKRELEELGFPPGKIHQINTFATPRARGTPDREAPYILYMGRFAPYKGVDTAIRAFARLREVHPRVRFCLIGDEGDEDAARVRAVVRECGDVNVQLIPFERDQERLGDWIGRALFTVAPSEFCENLPNAILESFAWGRPVIATRFGSLPEIVKDGQYGLLSAFADPLDLAAKMSHLISHDRERERMGERAFEALGRDYSEHAHVDRLLELFAAVIAKPR